MTTSLSEDKRTQLDSIVSRMEANKEPLENIQFVVNDFKQKYSVIRTPERSAASKIIGSQGRNLDIVGQLIGRGNPVLSAAGAVERMRPGTIDQVANYPSRLFGQYKDTMKGLLPNPEPQPSMGFAENIASGVVGGLGREAIDLGQEALTPAGMAANVLVPAAGGVLKRGAAKYGPPVMEAVLGPEAAAIAMRVNNPAYVKSLMKKPYNAIAAKFHKTLGDLSEKVGVLDQVAKATLSAEKKIPKKAILGKIEQLEAALSRKGQGAIGPVQEKALSYIEKAKKSVINTGGVPTGFRHVSDFFHFLLCLLEFFNSCGEFRFMD